jgi:hypothetical protein
MIRNLLADGPCTALHFRTGGGTSRSCRAFISDLTTLLTSTGPKPLVYTTDQSLLAIFRFYQSAKLTRGFGELDVSGQRFHDISGYNGALHLGTQYGDGKQCGIEIPEGGRWLDNRDPGTTHRHSLPVFDAERISGEIVALLERFADKLVSTAEPAPAVRRKFATDPQYGELDISTDPNDWDPADPRRKIQGFMDRIRELRREKFGGRGKTRAAPTNPHGYLTGDE